MNRGPGIGFERDIFGRVLDRAYRKTRRWNLRSVSRVWVARGKRKAGNYMIELQNSVAVVTGSSSGIGRATARLLARLGANVVVHGCSNLEGLKETFDGLEGSNRDHQSIVADLSKESGCNQFVDMVWKTFNRVDIWINFAGADVLTTAAKELSFDDKLNLLWQTDVQGTIRVCRLATSQMRKQPSGSSVPTILNMGWDQAEVGMGGEAGEMFGPIKSAVMAYTRSLARSVAPNIRVNAVAPGWIQTSWGDDAPDYWRERASRESLRGRWGSPEDVAAAAAYLVSPSADFITGQIMPVNGGFRHEFDPAPQSDQNLSGTDNDSGR